MATATKRKHAEVVASNMGLSGAALNNCVLWLLRTLASFEMLKEEDRPTPLQEIKTCSKIIAHVKALEHLLRKWGERAMIHHELGALQKKDLSEEALTQGFKSAPSRVKREMRVMNSIRNRAEAIQRGLKMSNSQIPKRSNRADPAIDWLTAVGIMFWRLHLDGKVSQIAFLSGLYELAGEPDLPVSTINARLKKAQNARKRKEGTASGVPPRPTAAIAHTLVTWKKVFVAELIERGYDPEWPARPARH